MEKIFSVGDLKKLISESSNEFKAVLGPNVESEDKKNNGKAYSDAKKRAKDYDGGLEKEVGEDHPKYEKIDGNRTTLGYNPEHVSQEYKDRVNAQAKGYTSTLEMNNGLEKTGDFKNNENIVDGLKDAETRSRKAEDDYKYTRVQIRNNNNKTQKREELYENSTEGVEMRGMIDRLRANEQKTVLKEHVKTVYFKKTAFLNEEHMISRIPDEFKKEGEQFKMRDKTGNEYLMEWRNNTGKILAHENKNKVNESLEKIRRMFDYTTNDTNTTADYRLNEGGENLKATLDKVRNIKTNNN